MSYEQDQYDDVYVEDERIAAYTAQAEYAGKIIEAECRAPFCLATNKSTALDLTRQGWQLGAYSQFCPFHSKGNC